VRWNKFDVAETWKNDASGNGQAGFMDVSEEPSELLTIVPLGNYFAAYKEQSVQLLTYVGIPVIWARRQVITGRGLISPKAVVSLGDFHIAAFTDNFYIFNGASLTRIGDPIRDDFFGDLSPSKKHLTFAFHIEDKGEVGFAYPSLSASTPDKAWVYNYLLNAWSLRDFPFSSAGAFLSQSSLTWNDAVGTWDTQTGTWDDRTLLSNAPIPLVGDGSVKKVFKYDTTEGKNGAALSAYFTNEITDFGDPGRLKRVFRVKPVCEKLNVSMNVYIVTADRPKGDLTYNGPFSFNPSTDNFVDLDLVARYFALKMETTDQNQPFTVSGWEWVFQMQEDR
jgi:hypothetical protein